MLCSVIAQLPVVRCFVFSVCLQRRSMDEIVCHESSSTLGRGSRRLANRSTSAGPGSLAKWRSIWPALAHDNDAVRPAVNAGIKPRSSSREYQSLTLTLHLSSRTSLRSIDHCPAYASVKPRDRAFQPSQNATPYLCGTPASGDWYRGLSGTSNDTVQLLVDEHSPSSEDLSISEWRDGGSRT